MSVAPTRDTRVCDDVCGGANVYLLRLVQASNELMESQVLGASLSLSLCVVLDVWCWLSVL